jgi:hypothetical protein
LIELFDRGRNWSNFGALVMDGREEALRIFDLRFAIFEQRAKQGSLTIWQEAWGPEVEKWAKSPCFRLFPGVYGYFRINLMGGG